MNVNTCEVHGIAGSDHVRPHLAGRIERKLLMSWQAGLVDTCTGSNNAR